MCDGVSFGRILRELRQRKTLSQQMLGDLTALSVRAIRDLEAGRVQRPHDRTIRLLANGLRLSGPQRTAFEAAARGTGSGRPGRDGTGWTSPPAFSGPFIGREAEVAILTELLTTDADQVISMAGVAGSGKTRLASEVSKAILRRPGWRVAWFSGQLRADGHEPDSPPRLPLPGIGEHPGSNDMSKVLVVIDGLSDGFTRHLAERLRQVPRPHVLITTRSPVGLPRELAFPVGPLPVPAPYEAMQSFSANPSVRLLLWHLRRVLPSCQLHDDDAMAVARLCRLLDGLPSALELGAAMCTVRSPQRLARQLTDLPCVFRDWRSSAGSGESLLSSFAESLDSLSYAERALLDSLASSNGESSLDEAAAGAGLACADATEHMELLVRRGLVRHDREVGEPRFSILNLVRSAHCAVHGSYASTGR